ncbi:hypothetical protein B0T18DRAFT_227535 [Schizothecium vesticola]|uniref:Thioredoxin-like fold domain-containing protein n=1 Tax=Schizothecium vesticola TaxID=314040 RepID=A0AA40EKZ2_9PEZI|nr:hypothetical protein B0T18DRAFT_227535 [Schizothecium vesticola]
MPPPSSSSSSSSSGTWQIPRPLQRLFDTFPLVTYDRPADLPVRARHAISPSLPTLYIFTTPDDALVGAPSFNPGCLKWQTYLRLHSLDHLTLPSTNHASPTGSLPFLLPPISTPSSGSPALNPSSAPIPASGFPAYIARHKKSGTTTPSKTTPHPPSISREQTTTTTPKEDLKAKIREELILSLLPPSAPPSSSPSTSSPFPPPCSTNSTFPRPHPPPSSRPRCAHPSVAPQSGRFSTPYPAPAGRVVSRAVARRLTCGGCWTRRGGRWRG